MALKREADIWDRDSGQEAAEAAVEDAVVLGPELPPEYKPVTFPEERAAYIPLNNDRVPARFRGQESASLDVGRSRGSSLPALDNSGLDDDNVFIDQTSFSLDANSGDGRDDSPSELSQIGDTIRGYYEDYFTGGNSSGAADEFVQNRAQGGFIDTSEFGGEAAPVEAFGRGQQSGQEFAERFTDNEAIQQGIGGIAGGAAAVGDVATAGLQGQALGLVADTIDEVAMIADLSTSALREVQIAGDSQTVGSRLWSTLSGLMEVSANGGDLNTAMKVAAITMTSKSFVDRAVAGEDVDWRDLVDVFSFNTESSKYGDLDVPTGHSAWQALTAGPEAVRQAYDAIENRDELLAEKQARADTLAVIAEDVTVPEDERDAAALARAQIGVEIEEDANKTATDIANEHTSIWNDLIFDTVFDPAQFLEFGTKALTAIRAAELGIEGVQSTNALRAAAGAADEIVDTPIPQLERLFNDVIAQGDELVGSEARQSLGRFTPARVMADLNPLNLVAADRAQQAIDGLTYTLSSVLSGVTTRAEAANLLDILASRPTQLIDEGLELADIPSRAEFFADAQDVFTFAQSTIANKGFTNNFDVLVNATNNLPVPKVAESSLSAAESDDLLKRILVKENPSISDADLDAAVAQQRVDSLDAPTATAPAPGVQSWGSLQSLRGNEPLNLREVQAELVQKLRASANDIYGVVQEGGAFSHNKATELALKTIGASKKFLSEINLFARPAYMVNNAISGNVFLLDDGLMSNSTFDELGGMLSNWFGPDSVVTQRLGEAVGTLDEDVIRSSAVGEEISTKSIFRNLTGGRQNPIAWWVEKGIDLSSNSAALGNLPVGESRMYLTAFANATQQALTRQARSLLDSTKARLAESGIAPTNVLDNVVNEMVNGSLSGTDGRRRLQEVLAGQAPIFPWAELGIADDAIPIVVRDGINSLMREGLDADAFVERAQGIILNRVDTLASKLLDTPPSYDGSNMFDIDLLQDASSVSDELSYAAKNADIPVVPADEQKRINALFAEIETGMEALLGVAGDAVGPGVDVVFDTYQDVLRYMDDARRITDVSSSAAQKGEKAWDAHYELINQAWQEVQDRVVEAYGRGMDNMVNPDYQRRYSSTSDERLSDLILADEDTLRIDSAAGGLGDANQFRAAVDANRALVDRARYVAFQAVQEQGDISSFNVLTSVNKLVEQVNAQSVAWRNHFYQQYKVAQSIDYDTFKANVSQMWKESAELKEWLWGNSAREILLRGGDAQIETGIAFRLDGQDVELLRPLASDGDGWVVRSDSGQAVVSGHRIPQSAKDDWEGLDYSVEQEQLQAYADLVGAPDTRFAALSKDPRNIDDAIGLVTYLETLDDVPAAFFMRDYMARWGDDLGEFLEDSFIERLGTGSSNEVLEAIGSSAPILPDEDFVALPDSLQEIMIAEPTLLEAPINQATIDRLVAAMNAAEADTLVDIPAVGRREIPAAPLTQAEREVAPTLQDAPAVVENREGLPAQLAELHNLPPTPDEHLFQTARKPIDADVPPPAFDDIPPAAFDDIPPAAFDDIPPAAFDDIPPAAFDDIPPAAAPSRQPTGDQKTPAEIAVALFTPPSIDGLRAANHDTSGLQSDINVVIDMLDTMASDQLTRFIDKYTRRWKQVNIDKVQPLKEAIERGRKRAIVEPAAEAAPPRPTVAAPPSSLDGPPPLSLDEPPAWLDMDDYVSPDHDVMPPDNEFIRMADHDPANTMFDRAVVNSQRTHGADGPDVGAMAVHIRQAMDDLLGYVRNNADGIVNPEKIKLTGRERMDMQRIMGDMFNQWDDTLFKSAQEGIRRADWNMINYSDRRNIDTVLAVISPWSYWSTRTMGTYAERMLNHPRLLTANANIDEAIAEENARSDVAIYHEGTIGNPFPFGPERIRDPRFAAFPQDGLFVKDPVDPDRQLGGEERFGAVTPVMNEIQRTFGLNPFVQYGADIVQKTGDGVSAADFNPYNYLWPMQSGGLVLSALGVDHAGGSDSLASNVLEEGVAAGKYTLDEAQWIQQYLLNDVIAPESVAAGVDVEALAEDARRTASRRKLMGARGVGLLGPIGGYSDTVGSQALREQGDLFRQLGFDDTGGDGSIEGSDAARDLFIAENPALRAVWTGAQLSDYFVRDDLDLEPAQVAANRNTRELRDSITDELFALDAAAKDNAINTVPDIKQGDVREAGRQAIIERARERLGDVAVDAFLSDGNEGATSIDIVNFVWETLAEGLFPSRVSDTPIPEWTGNGWAPYEVDEREYDLLIRNLNRMERPAYPGEDATSEQWDAWKAANDVRRQRQIAETERYMANASSHERKLIDGRSAEELVDAAEGLYRTDREVEYYKRQKEDSAVVSAHWDAFLGIGEEDFAARRQYIEANPDFEEILKQRADEAGKTYWWVESGLWDGYFAIDEDDWQGKREYIAANPDFEDILKRRADERGKDYWWTEQSGEVIERRKDGTIVRHSRPTDEQWAEWSDATGSERKLAYLNDNPAFATYYVAMYERKGYEPWWDVTEDGKFVRKPGGSSRSFSGRSSSSGGGGSSRSSSGRSGGSSNRGRGRSGGSGSGRGASGSYFRPFTVRPPRIRARQLSRELRRSILR